jgi:hypothetical protein
MCRILYKDKYIGMENRTVVGSMGGCRSNGTEFEFHEMVSLEI